MKHEAFAIAPVCLVGGSASALEGLLVLSGCDEARQIKPRFQNYEYSEALPKIRPVSRVWHNDLFIYLICSDVGRFECCTRSIQSL